MRKTFIPRTGATCVVTIGSIGKKMTQAIGVLLYQSIAVTAIPPFLMSCQGIIFIGF
jgi:hypothetical protein